MDEIGEGNLYTHRFGINAHALRVACFEPTIVAGLRGVIVAGGHEVLLVVEAQARCLLA